MSTQRMGSQGGVSDSTTPKPLCRQGSLYNLTLDEVQGSLGKSLSSMNLDELLKNVWNVEANQLLEINGGNNSVNNIQRQSSLLLSRDLSKKTVDEVWKEIQKGKKGSGGDSQERVSTRQNSLGEMTLEDFLAHVGVALDAPDVNGNKNGNSGHNGWVGVEPNVGQYQFLHQQQQSVMSMFMPGQHVPQTISVGGATSDSGFSEGQLGSRKRGAPGIVVEKTVERRQKRMIKNRESAARSRARKQAYTNELENKVAQLKAENERLRKEAEKALSSVPPPPPQPKYQLRRTSSAPF